MSERKEPQERLLCAVCRKEVQANISEDGTGDGSYYGCDCKDGESYRTTLEKYNGTTWVKVY